MSSQVILDASALLAILFEEPGSEVVAEVLSSCSISAVNYAEVLTLLVREGLPHVEAIHKLAALNLPVIPWDQALAEAAADLSPLAKTHGLSLGDRACLATARSLRHTVLTTERAWRRLPKLGIEIQFIR